MSSAQSDLLAGIFKDSLLTHNDLSKGLIKCKAQRRFLKVPASGNERS